MLKNFVRIIFLVGLVLSVVSCDDANADSPEISFVRLQWSNEAETKSIENIQKMPVLKVGDKVEMELRLNGKGNSLQSFEMVIDHENNKSVSIDFPQYREEDIFDDGNFTDFENGIVRFVDNVQVTQLTVSVRINTITSEELKLSFYLSNKADGEAGVIDAEFRLNN